MDEMDFKKRVEEIIAVDSHYPLVAYEFINAAVTFTINRSIDDNDTNSHIVHCHISASELLDGIAAFATQQFGPMAWDVLRCWRLQTPIDVGRVVFNMINHQLLSRSDDDQEADFNLEYDLKVKLQPPSMDETIRDLPIPKII